MSAGLPPPARLMPDELPARIGVYPIRGVIGTGSMGVVYLGHDPVISRAVAVKTIQRHLLEASNRQHSAAVRFRVEAQAAGRLNHRNIVSVYQFGEDENCAYIVMEYVRGHTLAEYLRRPGRFTKAEVLCLMFQLLDALHYAHESGIVHRDVKPANLMLDVEGRLKITDFGIARTESSQVTRVNTVVGSPGYMAPEQYTGGALDRRVDVFSAGVLLYQMLTGTRPFSGTDEAIMYQIVYGEHESLALRSGDPTLEVFEPILAGALAKLPAQRFATALEFRDALRAAANGPIADALGPRSLLPVQDLDATLPAPSARRLVPPVTGGSGSGSGSSGGTESRPPSVPVPSVPVPSVPVPTGWDETVLASLERELAQHVGPVARVLVRRAARGQTDLSTVRQLVAEAIVDLEVRSRFLSATASIGGASAPRTKVSHSGFADTRPASLREPVQLSADDVERAGVALARTLGPIAKVLAKRCADGSATREQFIAKVIEQLAARVDARSVETELWRSFK